MSPQAAETGNIRTATVPGVSDRIVLRGLEVPSIIGVHPHEREQAQPLLLDVELTMDLRPAGQSGRIAQTCDYSAVALEARALLKFRKYQLLEAAAEELSAMILGVHPGVESVKLRLTKPQALAAFGTGAAVEVERTPADYPRTDEDAAFGSVEILLETREAGLYLLHVDPENAIAPHHHRVMSELEWLVDGELWWDDKRIPERRPVQWEKGRVHGYRNRTDVRATVFCCDVPPFIREDEIEVAR